MAGGGPAPLIIGLTGPIGCGKSTIAGMLAGMGGTPIDADALAREATSPGEPAVAAIAARFGEAVVTPSGALDRAALAAIVFADARALADLEAIVHPRVRVLVERALEAARRAGDPFVVVEAIKLVEGGLAERCDEVWLVECPPDVQRSRLVARGMEAADVERRIEAQGQDLAERLAAVADRRIATDASLEVVEERVADALADVLAARFGGLPIAPVQRPSGRR